MDYKWLGPYEITKDLSKGFFSLKNIESGKEFKRIHGAHLKQYVTPPNSPDNVSHSPPPSPLPSDDEQLRVDFDSSREDSVPPLPPSIPHQVYNDSMLMDAQLTNCNHTDPASQVLTSSREILILPQPTKDLDQSLSRRSTPPSPQLQPSKPLLNSDEETKTLYSEVHIFLCIID